MKTNLQETPCILWFRQDLRLTDNPALHEALRSGKPIVAAFILDDESAGVWKWGSASRWWLHHSLKSLEKSLSKHKVQLVIAKGDSEKELYRILKETKADAVYWNRLYQPFAIKRDTKIKERLQDDGYTVQSENSNLLHEPWSVKNQSGSFFKVYTPFSKACFAKPDPVQPLPAPKHIQGCTPIKSLSIEDLNLLPDLDWDKEFYDFWEPGEKGAQEKLEIFLDEGIQNYKEGRNYPNQESVSRLSPHLQWGEISPRQIWYAVRAYEVSVKNKAILENTTCYLKEILWREFSYSLLYNCEDLPRNPINKNFRYFPWVEDDVALEAWQKGQTGYPIVDAAMRQLWTTGWMHNRCRMVVGSFLVKDLRIHWHHGEAWFWDTLVDADLASNSASWQWIAGCGADAAPYFRVFNPSLQSVRFDAKGDYIRRYVPELKNMPDKYIHSPWEAPKEILEKAGVVLGKTYPKPIVDHSVARDKALEAYKSIKGHSSDDQSEGYSDE